MRTCTRVATHTLGAVLLAAPLAAQGFEGVANFRMAGAKGEMVQYYKGGKVRMEGMGMNDGYMLMEPGTMKVVMTKEKMVMVMDASGKGRKSTESPKITDLGTHETIAGKNCENYLVEGKESHEICVAKGMGYFMFGSPGGPMGRGRGPTLPDIVAGGAGGGGLPPMLRDGFFPLRITKVSAGKRELQLEATLIEAKPLDPALFEIDPEFKEMRMPSMPGM